MAHYTDIIRLCVQYPRCWGKNHSDSPCPMKPYCFGSEADRRIGENDADYTARVESMLCAAYDDLKQKGMIPND